MPKLHKKQSKRMSVKKKYKIERKIREHHRKVKKQARKNPVKRKPKDPGVPNSVPFKNEILQEAAAIRKQKEELREKQKQDRHVNKMKNRNLSDIEKDAQKRGKDFEKKENEKVLFQKELKSLKGKGINQTAYYKEFHKVVEASDVVLQVLDARDPMGTRCPTVERSVSNSSDKKLILVLNKIDLVPRENLIQWVKYLRAFYPTIPFKASTQTQQENLSRSRVSTLRNIPDLLQSSRCLGAEALMKLLGSYSRSDEIRKSITVGVVGFPNVGKSSLINSLKRSKKCSVGATPGLTKVMQEIHLDSHIKILDSPGVVLAAASSGAGSAEETAIALKNASKIELLTDPIAPAETILRRANKEQIMLYYRLPSFNDSEEFLSLLAKRLGKLRKGGVPDVRVAARKLLQDWNSGKIKYFTQPPDPIIEETTVESEIVTQMAQPFDIEALYAEQEEEIKSLSLVLPSDAILVTSSGLCEAKLNDEMKDEEISEDEDTETMEMQENGTVVEFPTHDKKSNKQDSKVEKKKSKGQQILQSVPPLKSIEMGEKLNKARKMEFKKMKRQQIRNAKRESKLADSLQTSMTLNSPKKDQSYSFDVDFASNK